MAHRPRLHVDERSDRWIAGLAAAAEAPMPPGEGEPEFDEEPRTWWERLRTGTRRNIHRRYDRVVRPGTGLLEDAVIATWELRSRSRIVRPTAEMYDQVLRAHQELDGGEERLAAYRATKHALEHNRPLRASRARRRPRGPTVTTVQTGRSAVRGAERETGQVRHGDPALQNNDDAEVEEFAKLTAEENDRAAKVEDRSVVTIVVATMLSSNERVKRDLSAGVNELRGAYLAPRDWNQLDGLGRNPLVRLVLANFGGESRYAEKVAGEIRAYAERDPSAVAVTGLGQSHGTTRTASRWSARHCRRRPSATSPASSASPQPTTARPRSPRG